MQRLLAIVLLVAGCGGADDPSDAWPRAEHPGVERIDAPSGIARWPAGGYVELVPPVRLPTTHDRRGLIQVWLRLPPGGRITTELLEEQQRHTISLPPGSRVDRVESLGYAADGEEAWTIVDVRGVRFGRGPPTVHVLRPTGGEPQAPLAGYAWRAGSREARRHATELLLERLRVTSVPIEQAPMDESALDRFAQFNRCGHCHRSNMAVSPDDRGDLPHRATDASGCFVPLTVLRSTAPISEARPNDLNADDPYVGLRCADGSELREAGGTPTCENGWTPLAWRDVARGMAEGDRYTQRVCASRRYLHDHLDALGREAFAEGFEACGIPGTASPARSGSGSPAASRHRDGP